MMDLIKPNAAPVPSILVASVLDEMAKLPVDSRLEVGHVIGIARGIDCNPVQTGAVLARDGCVSFPSGQCGLHYAHGRVSWIHVGEPQASLDQQAPYSASVRPALPAS